MSNGLSVRANSQDRRVVGPFLLETSSLILMPWSSLWVLMRCRLVWEACVVRYITPSDVLRDVSLLTVKRTRNIQMMMMMMIMMMRMKTLFNESETVTAYASNIIIKLVARTIQNAAQSCLERNICTTTYDFVG